MSGPIDPAEITVIVIAKEPLPGRAKTRLAPALGEGGAALLAEAALADTLAAVAAGPRRSLLLALDGTPGPWLPPGFEVTPQRGEGLAERLGAAFEDAGGPALLLGMDTPQISAGMIEEACETLSRPGTDAVIGLARDGGWWSLGLRRPDRRAFEGVPMSEEHTGAAQLASLAGLGLAVARLPELIDVDTIDDAHDVAAQVPDSRFAVTLEAAVARAAEG
jgi:rSAM/selenodomain-associated transferase 1